MKKFLLDLIYFFSAFLFVFISMSLFPYILAPLENIILIDFELLFIPYLALLIFFGFRLLKSNKKFIGGGIITAIIFFTLLTISSLLF